MSQHLLASRSRAAFRKKQGGFMDCQTRGFQADRVGTERVIQLGWAYHPVGLGLPSSWAGPAIQL